MLRRPPRSTPLYSSAASDVYKRQSQCSFVVYHQRTLCPIYEAGASVDVEGAFSAFIPDDSNSHLEPDFPAPHEPRLILFPLHVTRSPTIFSGLNSNTSDSCPPTFNCSASPSLYFPYSFFSSFTLRQNSSPFSRFFTSRGKGSAFLKQKGGSIAMS
eukprot:TRINITY_DN16371_c0_g1_i1.p1 TRINITY_DN16371_c0_g1~~TRINITY_DN16371_c0_g1_i1.p1  ORF type:complete len:165 (+),score=3.94 TRINITY_DN16371_c0_g1_i1:25-495(+)